MPQLARQVRPDHPNHHLFDNNGTWWCQVTIHEGPTSRRARFSLKTNDLPTARQRRDRIFAALQARSQAASSNSANTPASLSATTKHPR